MQLYKHTQIGWVSIVAILGGALLMAWVGLIGSAPRLVLQVTSIAIVLVAIVFSYQTIEVTDTLVSSRFGFGVLRKSLALSDIIDVQYAPSRWYDGWGLRLTSRGWLYNVSGFDAVEFVMRDKSRIRFGTDDSANLIDVLRGAVPAAKGRRS